ncbi:MAG: MBL fold metallo-hydrolase [Pseudomonadota bacterium]
MKIHQVRNATILVDYGNVRLLVDPMLMDKHTLPPLRLFRYRKRNPAVGLPKNAAETLSRATHCLITHFQKGHFDHLDKAAVKWLRGQSLPVFCVPRDADLLAKKGLRVMPLERIYSEPQRFHNGTIQLTPCRHGRGFAGMFMEHGVGYFIRMPGEPSLLVTGDTILTPELRAFVKTHEPDVVVAPAGGARFDIGGEIIMNARDMVELAKLTPGTIIANHMGAIGHCPVTRSDVTQLARQTGLQDRIFAPADGGT